LALIGIRTFYFNFSYVPVDPRFIHLSLNEFYQQGTILTKLTGNNYHLGFKKIDKIRTFARKIIRHSINHFYEKRVSLFGGQGYVVPF
jgi:putative transposon-encoded protein